ncbi:MAG: hypothetical protein Q4G60_12400 [bacterium]|nr:hypothetical protein [bacterium]
MKYSVEYRRKMPSGEIRWFAATAVLIEDSAEEIVNAFIYSRDIDTKMKRRIARNQIVDADVEDITIINIAHKTCQGIEQK